MEKQLIRFAGRKAMKHPVLIGYEGDNLVERLEFDLPEITAGQTATLMITGVADAAKLDRTDEGRYAVDLTRDMIGPDGEREAYVRIDGTGERVWQSTPMRLITGALPDVEEEIEKVYPTAVGQMLTAMAEHSGEMQAQEERVEQAAQRAEEAAERAEEAAERAEAGGGGCGSGSTVEIDATLTQAGKAADAKATGDRISELSKEIDNLKESGGSGGVAPNVYNVRDFGAVGDGVTDDRQAIVDAFSVALDNLPCEVYFPAGEYGIASCIRLFLTYGSGGLSIKGAGREITTIKYLPEWTNVNGWYAISIDLVDAPTSEEDYLHDISIDGLTVYDTDPIGHAWHPDKGDPDKEETHGVGIQRCHRASITNCSVIDVGDEAIDIHDCHDAIISGNHVEGSPGAGTAGGAISVGDGCRGVIVSNNTVHRSALDETLEDGTVLSKQNFGIAIESLYEPVSDVTIVGNTISDIQGRGISIAATNDGSSISNVVIADNIIENCVDGIATSGTYLKENIVAADNVITDCADYGIRFHDGHKNSSIANNLITNTRIAIAMVSSDSFGKISGCVIRDTRYQSIFCTGFVLVSDCLIDGDGLDGSNAPGSISGYTGSTVHVDGCSLQNIQMKKGIYNATSVVNTTVKLANGGDAVSGGYAERIVNCDLNGRIAIYKPNAIVSGVRITSDSIGSNAITINSSGSTITGCVIKINNYNAIKENEGCDYNLIANNVCNKSIAKVGANSVEVNNIVAAAV